MQIKLSKPVKAITVKSLFDVMKNWFYKRQNLFSPDRSDTV
jgi:hypothetical protein